MGGIRALALLAALAAPPESQEPGPPAPAEPKASAPVADGRRTSARFVVNLGRNVLGVFARDNIKPFLLGVAVTGASAALDGDVERYFGPKRRAKWLGDAVDVEGQPHILAPVGVALFAAGRLSHPQRFRDATYDIAQAMLVETMYSTSLKAVTRRTRPDGSNRLSFPSGHTSNAFACAMVAAHYYGPKVAVPAYLLAGLVGVGRMEKNAHHLSDVMAGATLGTIVGRTVVRENAAPLGRAPRISIAPAHDPHGLGTGLLVRAEF